MKRLISFLVLVIVLHENVSCYGSDTSLTSIRQFTPEAMVHLLSEQVRNLIRTGDEANGVPVLDPYDFELRQLNLAAGEKFSANVNITDGKFTGLGNYILKEFNFSKSDISIELNIDIPTLKFYSVSLANLTDGKFTGLGNYILKEFNFSKSDISIELNIDIPSLKFYSEYYELDGNIYEAIPIKGQGIADIEIQNISLWGKVYLKQSADGKSILLDKIVDPEYSIERIVSRTEFDNNIDGVISSMVEDLLADYLTRFNKYIATSYSDHIAPFLNPTLDNYENWNLIAVLLYDEYKY